MHPIHIDYNKGFVSPDVAKNCIELCTENNIPVIVDTKNSHGIFGGATVLKCNQYEWDAHIKTKTAFKSQWDLYKIWGIDAVVVTDGERGIRYWSCVDGIESLGSIPGIKTEICDPCGAGDTVLAILGIMTALRQPIDKACELANIAAAEVCRHPGVYAIQKKDLETYILPIE